MKLFLLAVIVLIGVPMLVGQLLKFGSDDHDDLDHWVAP